MNEKQDSTADDLARRYVALRDFYDETSRATKDKLAKINTEMEKVLDQMKAFLATTGVDSAKTSHGTFFKKTTTSVKVADWDVALAFVLDNQMYQMLERRVSKTAVEEYIGVHNAVPPGVDVVRMMSVEVHRPKMR